MQLCLHLSHTRSYACRLLFTLLTHTHTHTHTHIHTHTTHTCTHTQTHTAWHADRCLQDPCRFEGAQAARTRTDAHLLDCGAQVRGVNEWRGCGVCSLWCVQRKSSVFKGCSAASLYSKNAQLLTCIQGVLSCLIVFNQLLNCNQSAASLYSISCLIAFKECSDASLYSKSAQLLHCIQKMLSCFIVFKDAQLLDSWTVAHRQGV